MDLLDRLLAHDTWTTRQLLLRCQQLTDEQLDQEFDIIHSMHHRAQLLYMLRLLGLTDLPEGDVLSWESHAGDA